MTTQGRVKWYNSEKGYGFITPAEGGADVFVHSSALKRASLANLVEGLLVQYEIVRDKRTGKSAADNLLVLGEPGAESNSGLLEFESQSGVATFFLVSELEGRLVPDLSAGGELLLRTLDARDRHSELRRLLNNLIAGYDPSTPGANATKFVIDDAQLLLEALGENIEKVRPGLLIPRGEVLRQIEAQQQVRDVDSDTPALGDGVRRSLRSVISAYNHFVQLDPELARRDEALLDPDDASAMLPPEQGLLVANELFQSGILAEFGLHVLETEAKVSPAAGDPKNRNSRRFSQSVRNLVRAVVSKSMAQVNAARRGIGRTVGTGVAVVALSYACGNWVIKNEVWLKTTFSTNPSMEQVISDLVDALKSLPLS